MSSAVGEATFKALFAQEYNRLCRYALTYVHDTHQAEDIVQETFIKIWEGKRDLIASPDIRFYLITAVRNNCISALRKLKSQPVHYTEETPEPEPEISFTTAQHKEAANEQSKRITAALNNLPPKCREVFLLIKMQGLSYKQAAETLNISIKTVENQMGKAIKVLRESIAGQIVSILWLLLFQGFFKAIGVLCYDSVSKIGEGL